jgi:hypothetical protein
MRSIQARKQERGVTILLIAVSLAALLAMAALAIDVVTLYVARTEAQRAADAAALAGARMIASSGYTTSGISWNGGDTAPLCPPTSGPGTAAAVNQQAEAAAAQNPIAGQPAAVSQITCNLSAGNPTVTVTTQRTSLPTFFARIWGRTASSVSATATAEAYNPSWFAAAPPPTAVSVKPWLLPNCDPYHSSPANGNCPASASSGAYFFNQTTGAPQNNASYVGNATPITLTRIRPCPGPGWCAPPQQPSASYSAGIYSVTYYRLDVPIYPPAPVCPGASTGIDYEDNIECSSTFQVSCGQEIDAPPANPTNPSISTTTGLGVPTNQGVQTLIHAGGQGTGQGQDTFAPTGSGPVTITAGPSNPNFSALGTYASISRSDSIVTVPIYDGREFNVSRGQFCDPTLTNCTTTNKVIGFAQLAITQNDAPPQPAGTIEAIILNAVGCPSPGSPPPVTGGGVSAVPVRLVCIPGVVPCTT